MDQASRRRWPVFLAPLLVLLVAAFLRLYMLPDLPLGLHYDEAANGILAAEIARGNRTPVFIQAYTGKEVLFFYWASLWMRLAGASSLGLRLAAASAGLLTVSASVWATRELLHGFAHVRLVTLLTGAFVATSFWHVVLSRYGFRAVTQPLLQALTVACLWRGLRQSAPRRLEAGPRGRVAGWLWIALAGAFLGGTAYTYLAARVFPMPVAASLGVLIVAGRGRRRAWLSRITLVVGVAALILAPLAYFWVANPGTFFNRARQVAATSWSEAWRGIRACLAMFFIRGDPYVRFNIPGRPLFGPVVAILAGIGLASVAWDGLRRVRRHASDSQAGRASDCALAGHVFLLVVVPIMLLPSALATREVTPSNLRAVGLLPFLYVLPAVGLVRLVSVTVPRAISTVPRCLWAGLILVGAGGATGEAYLRRWSRSPALYDAADGDMVDVAAYLNATGEVREGNTYVASVHYRHPTVAFLARDYPNLRWLTAGRTIVVPGDASAHIVLPRSAARDRSWVEAVLPSATLVAAPDAPGGGTAFLAYRVPAGTVPEPSRRYAARFGEVVELVGYDVLGEPASGVGVELALWWRVLSRPLHGDESPVARVVDPWGSVWGESNAFHYPGEQWAPGELVVDHLTIPVALGAPPGSYRVRVSMYSAQAQSALPVLDTNGRYAGTWVALPISLIGGDSLVGGDANLDWIARRLDIRHRVDKSIGGLHLLGANVDTIDVRPGEPVRFTLFWASLAEDLHDWVIEVWLGEDLPLYVGRPVHGSLPFPAWDDGQVVADRYDPRLSRTATAGERRLRIRLSDGERGSDHGFELDLGSVSVRDIDRSFALPAEFDPVGAYLSGRAELIGYGLTAEVFRRGDPISLTLYWRCQTEMDQDYTVFVHLIGADGRIVGQHDGQPVDGSYPTTLWTQGEVIEDVHEVEIVADAAPGVYLLEVGMYVGHTGERLIDSATGRDHVRLQRVAITDPL